MTKWYNPITTTNDAEVKGVSRMTKEELLAEEYICNGKCQDDITRNYVHCKSCTRVKDFLAGLKAGRPQWHKVADGDLPKETGEYLTNIGVLTWDYYADGRYGWHTECCEFCDCCDDIDSDEIIAWCEIPKFDDKE